MAACVSVLPRRIGIVRDRMPKSPALLFGAVAVLCASLKWAPTGRYSTVGPTPFYICSSMSAEMVIAGRRADQSYGVHLYGWPIERLLLFCRAVSNTANFVCGQQSR